MSELTPSQPGVSESDTPVEKSDTKEKLGLQIKKEEMDAEIKTEETSESTGKQNSESKSDLSNKTTDNADGDLSDQPMETVDGDLSDQPMDTTDGDLSNQPMDSADGDLSNQPVDNADGDDASEEMKSQEDSKEDDSNLSTKKDSISPSALLDDNATTHSDNNETEANETGPVRSRSPDAHSDSESKQSFFEKIGLLGEGMKMKKSSETLDKNVMHREYSMYDESAFPAVDLDENGLPINAEDMNEEDREKREKKMKFVKEISALRRMLLTKGFIRGSKWRPTPSYIKQRDSAMSGKKGFGSFSLDPNLSDESTPDDSSMDGSPSRTIYRQDGSASAGIYHLDGNPSATIYRPDGSPSANIYCQDGGTSATIYRKGVSKKRGPVKEMMKRCRPCKVGLTDFFKELDIDVSELSKDFPLVKRIKVIDYNSQSNNPPTVEQDSYEGSFLSFISSQSETKSPGKNFKRTSYSKQWTEGNENRTVTVSKVQCKSKGAKSSTSPPRFSCVHCQYSCQEKELMTEHIYAHITEKVFRCGICGLDFTTFGTAAIHHQAVHQLCPQKIEKKAEIDETEHYLEICENLSDDENKQSTNETNKGEETENKSNDDENSSDEKSSKTSPVFISVVVNGGSKQGTDKKVVVEVSDRFQCTYCKFSTDQREIIRQHTASEHTGAVHYTCTLCDGLVLTSKANLLSHYNSVHPGKTIKCRKLPDFTDTEEPQHPVEPPTNRYNRYRSNIYGRGGLLSQGRFGSTDGVSASGTDMGLKIVNVVSLHSGRHSGQSRRPGSGTNNNCIIPPEGFMVPVLLNAKTMSLKYASSSANRKCKYPGDDDPLISRSIYMCKKCGCEAKFLSQMQDHIINSHSAFCMYTCAYCTFKGEKEADIYKHINIAHSDCDSGVPLSFFLDPVYITKYIANIEKSQQTRYKEKLVGKLSHYKCRICNQEYPDGISLYMHYYRMHDKTLSYHCPYCTDFSSDLSDPMRDHVSNDHGKDISSEAVFAFICDGIPNRDPDSLLSAESSSAPSTPMSALSKPSPAKSFRKDDDVVIIQNRNNPLKPAGQAQSVIRPSFTPRGRSRGRPPRSQTILLRNMLQARANASSSPSSSGPLQPMMIVANAAHEENQGSPPIVIDHPERTPKPLSITGSSTPEPTGDGTLDMDCENVDEDNPVDSVVDDEDDDASTVSKSVPYKSSKRQSSRSASHQLSELAARSAAEHSADIIPSQPFPLKVIKKENDMYLTTADTSLHNDQVVPVSLQAAQGAVPLDLSSAGTNESEDMPPDAFKVFNLSPAASQLASYLPTTPNTYSSPVPVGPPIQTADYSGSLTKTSSSEDRYNKEIYRCDKCNFKTTYRAALKTHHTFRHSQIYKCPYCTDTVPLDSFEVEPHIKQLHPDEKIAYMRI